MAGDALYAGPNIRRLRRRAGISQAALAKAAAVSPAYMNLIERNQRPLTAPVLLRLADALRVDPRALADGQAAESLVAVRRRLRDPMFADLGIDDADLADWQGAAPATVAAFTRLYDLREPAASFDDEDPSIRRAQQCVERWRNHFADLDAHAEALADELRLGGGDPYGAVSDRLRTGHRITVRVLPDDVMPEQLRRLDLHARQLQLAERMKPASRTFQSAVMLSEREAGAMVDALVRGAEFGDPQADQLLRRHLIHYHAAATLMPYARFLRACEATGYDLFLLQRRFGAGFEQVAHRLTTLQRVGARGLPFFMLRIDRAGQVSKRFAGASGSPLATGGARCPLWRAHHCFLAPGDVIEDRVALEDGSVWRTYARTTLGAGATPTGEVARFAIILGVDDALARAVIPDRRQPLPIMPIGLGCRRCTRHPCSQRSAPPAGRTLRFVDYERGASPFVFDAD